MVTKLFRHNLLLSRVHCTFQGTTTPILRETRQETFLVYRYTFYVVYVFLGHIAACALACCVVSVLLQG